MNTLPKVSSSNSSPIVSVKAPVNKYRNYSAHRETISVSPVALDHFMYWHAGWSVIEMSSDFDFNINAIHQESPNLPLFLHNLSWDAGNDVLVIDTLKTPSSKQIPVITFRVPRATNIRTEFISSLPIRHVHIECEDGRGFTVILQLNLRHREEYVKAVRGLPTSDASTIFCPSSYRP